MHFVTHTLIFAEKKCGEFMFPTGSLTSRKVPTIAKEGPNNCQGGEKAKKAYWERHKGMNSTQPAITLMAATLEEKEKWVKTALTLFLWERGGKKLG